MLCRLQKFFSFTTAWELYPTAFRSAALCLYLGFPGGEANFFGSRSASLQGAQYIYKIFTIDRNALAAAWAGIALSSMPFFCSPAAAAPVNLPANWPAKKFSFFHVNLISSIQPIFGTATNRINFWWKSVSSFNYKLFEDQDDCLSLYNYLCVRSYHQLHSKVRDRHKN